MTGARLAAFVVGTMLTVACGSTVEGIAEGALEAEFDADVDIDGDTYTVTDDTGSMRIGTELPGGLDIPILNGGSVRSAMERTTAGATSHVVELQYPVDRYDDLITFYEAVALDRDEPVELTQTADFLTTTWTWRGPTTDAVEVILDPNGVTVRVADGL